MTSTQDDEREQAHATSEDALTLEDVLTAEDALLLAIHDALRRYVHDRHAAALSELESVKLPSADEIRDESDLAALEQVLSDQLVCSRSSIGGTTLEYGMRGVELVTWAAVADLVVEQRTLILEDQCG